MRNAAQWVALCADELSMAWHAWRRDTHARAHDEAEARFRARVLGWLGEQP